MLAQTLIFFWKNMKYIVLGLSLILFVGCGVAQIGALSHAYLALRNDDCGLVYRKLSDAEGYKKPSPELQAEISYLRSLCLEKEKKYDEALALLYYITEQFPKTEYGYRARIRIERIESLFRQEQKNRTPSEKTEPGI